LLASILRKSRHGVRLNEHLEHPDGAEVFQHASQMGLEGIVVQAARVALQIRPLAGLAEVQEPGGTCSEAGGGRGLGAVMTDQGNISEDQFSYIVRYAPLPSLDLIIRDSDRRVLVGLRTNEPAKSYYFVPGGVIRKNESIELAFARILRAETGCRASLSDARFLGVFQHFYSTNRFGDASYGTHYIVLAYELRLDHRPVILLDEQHSKSKWMADADLVSASDVHENTKAYFREDPP
jgi:colanic acid biosynthesis protein WcaH